MVTVTVITDTLMSVNDIPSMTRNDNSIGGEVWSVPARRWGIGLYPGRGGRSARSSRGLASYVVEIAWSAASSTWGGPGRSFHSLLVPR